MADSFFGFDTSSSVSWIFRASKTQCIDRESASFRVFLVTITRLIFRRHRSRRGNSAVRNIFVSTERSTFFSMIVGRSNVVTEINRHFDDFRARRVLYNAVV